MAAAWGYRDRDRDRGDFQPRRCSVRREDVAKTNTTVVRERDHFDISAIGPEEGCIIVRTTVGRWLRGLGLVFLRAISVLYAEGYLPSFGALVRPVKDFPFLVVATINIM